MEQLAQSQPMGEVPERMDPIQPEQHREDRNAWADVGHRETATTQNPSGSDVGGTRPVCAMRNQGNAHAGAASGVCCQHNKPSEPAQQDRLPLGECSPECLQGRLCDTKSRDEELMESMAIATILNMGCEQVAHWWQQELAKQHTRH